MLPKIILTVCVSVFSVLIPYLEINASHVFNPDWIAHARFHEVWQLTTNILIGILCLWLIWIKNNIQIAGVLSIIVMGGVLFAHLIEESYGGSVLSGNLSKTILGLESAAFVALLVVLLAVIAIVLDYKSKRTG